MSYKDAIEKLARSRVEPDKFWSDKLVSDSIAEARNTWDRRTALMEQFARYVITAGYLPSECLIQHCTIRAHSFDHGSEKIDRLLVRGEPCFEVRTVQSPMVDFKWTITVEPKVIKWPDPIPCAPGTAHATMIGDPQD